MIYLNRMRDNFAEIDRYVRTAELLSGDSRSVNSSRSGETEAAMPEPAATTDFSEDLGQRRPRVRRSDVKIITELRYDSLDEAAMAAAKKLYEKCGEEKPDGEKKWGIEYGIVIHKNRLNRKFYLTTIIRGTRSWVDLGCGIALGRGKYRYVSDLHSHPVRSSINNEPSGGDYYRTLLNNDSKYLLVNVGIGGTLIKFTPPNSRSASLRGRKLFEDKVRELLGMRRNGVQLRREELIDNIPKISRQMIVEFITKIIGRNDGQLQEEGQLQETPITNNTRLESLDPQTILWKFNAPKAIMVKNGNHHLMDNIENDLSGRYKSREFTYDARHTVTYLQFYPDKPTIIEKAFVGFIAVRSVTIPNSVIEIGKEAFRDCTSLESVAIPDSVTSIGNFAFQGCTNLTSITIPSSVASIGAYAFRGCTSLISIISSNPVPPDIVPEAFYGLLVDAYLYVPENSIDIYRVTQGWRIFGQNIKSFEQRPRYRGTR